MITYFLEFLNGQPEETRDHRLHSQSNLLKRGVVSLAAGMYLEGNLCPRNVGNLGVTVCRGWGRRTPIGGRTRVLSRGKIRASPRNPKFEACCCGGSSTDGGGANRIVVRRGASNEEGYTQFSGSFGGAHTQKQTPTLASKQ